MRLHGLRSQRDGTRSRRRVRSPASPCSRTCPTTGALDPHQDLRVPPPAGGLCQRLPCPVAGPARRGGGSGAGFVVPRGSTTTPPLPRKQSLRLHDDRELARDLGRRGNAYAQAHHDWSSQSGAFVAAVRVVMDGRIVGYPTGRIPSTWRVTHVQRRNRRHRPRLHRPAHVRRADPPGLGHRGRRQRAHRRPRSTPAGRPSSSRISTWPSRAVAQRAATATTEMPTADVYLIAVPTPFKGDHEPGPVLRALRDRGDRAAAARRARSSSSSRRRRPGPPSRSPVARRARAPTSSFPHQPGVPDVHVAHCPERVLPGRIMIEMVTNDRVVGGLTPACAPRPRPSTALFVQGRDPRSPTPTAAEMAKLIENAFRDVNIAFANELADDLRAARPRRVGGHPPWPTATRGSTSCSPARASAATASPSTRGSSSSAAPEQARD